MTRKNFLINPDNQFQGVTNVWTWLAQVFQAANRMCTECEPIRNKN